MGRGIKKKGAIKQAAARFSPMSAVGAVQVLQHQCSYSVKEVWGPGVKGGGLWGPSKKAQNFFKIKWKLGRRSLFPYLLDWQRNIRW